MDTCRICEALLEPPVFEAQPPSISSICTLIPAPAVIHACRKCGHVQSPNLPSIEAFYDTEYRISLATEGYDQLYDMADGKPLFRAEHQARLVAATCAIVPGTRILDYGAAKAVTLRRIASEHPGVACCVYDVSQDYQSAWQEWIPADHQAVYKLPLRWERTFDLVTAHFVLEHVAEPVKILRDIASVLKPDGRVFILVPDLISNPGDLVVVDHVNHFTESSLTQAFGLAGLKIERLERNQYRGALLAVASLSARGAPNAAPDILQRDLSDVVEIAAFWEGARRIISQQAPSLATGKMAIYGAGFYGTFIAAALDGRATPECFVDRNPFVQAAPHLGVSVIDPDSLPGDITTVVAGLNPKIARSVLELWKSEIGRPDLRIVYLDSPV